MIYRFAGVLFVTLLCVGVSTAQDLDQWARNLEGRLESLQGPIDEGSRDYRNSVGTGSVKSWLTRPGDVSVSRPIRGAGNIRFNFTGREKDQDYRFYVHQATHYNNRSGYVTARYAFSFEGKVYISRIQKHGTSDRVGDGIVRALRSHNDTVIDGTSFFGRFDAEWNGTYRRGSITVTGDPPLEVEKPESEGEKTKKMK